MGKNLNWTAGFEWVVVQISSQLQVVSLGVHTGAYVPPSGSQVTGKKHPQQPCSWQQIVELGEARPFSEVCSERINK